MQSLHTPHLARGYPPSKITGTLEQAPHTIYIYKKIYSSSSSFSFKNNNLQHPQFHPIVYLHTKSCSIRILIFLEQAEQLEQRYTNSRNI